MRHLRILSMFALVTMLSGASLASAATLGAQVYGAFNTHSMGDINDLIDASPGDFNNVENGLTGGLDLRMWATPSWLFSAGWEPIFLESNDDASGSSTSFDANVFSANGAYFFPSAGNGKYGIGAGVAYYSVNGEQKATSSPTVELTGNSVGFHFMGLGEWTVSPGFAVTGGAGYRIAKVEELERSDGGVLEDTSDNRIETDYSGFMGRVGLAFYLPSGSN